MRHQTIEKVNISEHFGSAQSHNEIYILEIIKETGKTKYVRFEAEKHYHPNHYLTALDHLKLYNFIKQELDYNDGKIFYTITDRGLKALKELEQ